MGKRTTVHRCTNCGDEVVRWAGRCPACGSWNTLVEEPAGPVTRLLPVITGAALPIIDVDSDDAEPRPTGVGELDRVLGGGLVPGSITLIAGEPGIGKSTLLLQLAAATARHGRRVLYVTAEESRRQVRRRSQRLDALADGVWLAADTSLPAILGQIEAVRPDVVVIDSIQTVHDPDLASAPGSIVQVRECAQRLVTEAKTAGLAVILVGHVTKDGTIAGPRVLEHVVDTVLSFEGDRHHGLRLVRAVKHRFGSISELGVFEMTDRGLVDVRDASGLFLADRRPGVTGSAVVPAIDGSRPLLVEVQALVTPTNQRPPRRSAQGVDPGRLALLLAVLEQRVGIRVAESEVYALAVGGARVVEPGADLGAALAIASSVTGRPLPPDLVAFGEIGLGGEVRQVAHPSRRLAEAARLGFRRALVPTSNAESPVGLAAVAVSDLREALGRAGLVGEEGRPWAERRAG